MSIEKFGYALPGIKQSAAHIAEATGADETFVAEKVGLKTRYILGDQESGISLSIRACEDLFEKAPDLRDRVELLVCVTQNPDRKLPQNSAGIAAGLGLPNNIASFDISLGCSGYVYALSIVEGFLATTGLKNAVLVTADPYSRIMASEDRDTNAIFGDAATATWIRAGEGRSTVLARDFGTDGAGGDAIEVPAGGALRPHVNLTMGHDDVTTWSREEERLHMRGRAVFNFVMQRVPASIDACLEQAGLARGDIDWYALHQGSLYMLDALAKRAQLPGEKVLKNMQKYGNTVSSTIPLLLAELDENAKLGDATVLLSGFGVGLSWATVILKFE
ncbi:MAG: ketoacyl-ACP synthase III [Hyphomicrobiaceae bacterium]|nr:ketoacyl-ACP synthase III [Hyphomicrobiaceae bacterium]MCC0024954.1 ketoacyl-ACP synthase III [Hyphomicrobiaceae bacterium]